MKMKSMSVKLTKTLVTEASVWICWLIINALVRELASKASFIFIYLIFIFIFCLFLCLIFILFFYTGQFCETDIDECIEDQPCQSGTCNNLKGGYECDCFENFCGTNCQRRDVCIVSTHQAMGPKNY